MGKEKILNQEYIYNISHVDSPIPFPASTMFIQGIIRGSDTYWIEFVSPWEPNNSEDQNLLYDNIFVFCMRILYSKS